MKFYFNHWLNFTSCILQFPRLRFHLDIFLTLRLKILVSDISWYIFFELLDLYFVALLLKVHIVGSLFRFWLGLLVCNFHLWKVFRNMGVRLEVPCSVLQISRTTWNKGIGSWVAGSAINVSALSCQIPLRLVPALASRIPLGVPLGQRIVDKFITLS